MARNESNRRHEERRPARPETLERAHEWSAELQARTLEEADRSYERWSTVEDKVLIGLIDEPIEATCKVLGRSLAAVQSRRRGLRRTGVLG